MIQISFKFAIGVEKVIRSERRCRLIRVSKEVTFLFSRFVFRSFKICSQESFCFSLKHRGINLRLRKNMLYLNVGDVSVKLLESV